MKRAGSFWYGDPDMTKKSTFISIVFLSFTLSLFSFQLTPITANLAPSGSGSIQNFKVFNNTAEIIAIQMSMHSRSTTLQGEEINEPADHLFIVYPSQIILNPGEEQIVRVQWKGTSDPASELPFRIIAEQLPVDFSRNESESGGLKIMFRYVGSVYIGRKAMKPDVTVERLSKSSGADGQDRLELILHNRGTAHAILQNLILTITDSRGSTIQTLKGDSLEGIEGENILAGEKRGFTLPAPPDLTEGELNAQISFGNM